MIKRILRNILPNNFILYYHRVLGWFASKLYGNPSKDLIVIGVTGTNGKSTVTSFIGQLFNSLDVKAGWLSTAEINIGKGIEMNNTKMTMLGRFALQRHLREMVKNGCQFAVVETSSEGIVQFRHKFIHYDVAVFTNLTPEHIESHGGFDAYKAAKLKLFSHLEKIPRKTLHGNIINKAIVANGDDSYGVEFLDYNVDRKIAFVVDGDVETSWNGSEFKALGVDMSMSIPALFNVQNALAAISVVHLFDYKPEEIRKAVADLQPVGGRLEFIDEGQDFHVIVDYAPEPASMKKLYELVSSLEKKRVIHVFGSCGGGRDKARRPVLGEMVAQEADICIITNEDPYDEDPMEIMEQIAVGARKAGKKDDEDLILILDRKKAIEEAIKRAVSGDLILVTGKGSEQAMVMKNRNKIPWDDREVVREALQTYASS